MSTGQGSETTRLLQRWGQGDRQALDRLMDLVYPELRQRAELFLRGDRPGHTLQPTALVHEVYLRMVDVRRIDWKGRSHFLGLAGRLMRQILLDSARRHRAGKRGGGRRDPLSRVQISSSEAPVDVLDLDRALRKLAELDAGMSRMVELRFFAGATIEETAEVLGVSPQTVKRSWRAARVWLFRELEREAGEP